MHVMVAEDDQETAAWVRRGLAEAGHVVQVVATGTEAVTHGLAGRHDVLVLDRMLPELDGVEALRHLRAASVTTPIIMVTARGSISDRVDGLEAGADDYLVKPFALSELSARLNALVRRAPASARPTRFQVGDVSLDLLRREVIRDGRTVPLQPREFQLLEQLMRHAGSVVTRNMLLESVWGLHFDPQTNIVESHMSRMRAKLRERHGLDPVETVRGAGYRMRLPS